MRDKMLRGTKEITQYLGISSYTLHMWREHHGLPVAKTPSGLLMTTTTMIDTWLLSRHQSNRIKLEQRRAIARLRKAAQFRQDQMEQDGRYEDTIS